MTFKSWLQDQQGMMGEEEVEELVLEVVRGRKKGRGQKVKGGDNDNST